MTDFDDNVDLSDLSLTQLPDYEASRENQDQTVWYQLRYFRENGTVDRFGKLVEFGKVADSAHADLQPLADQGYTHYGIFRLKGDRSTTTLIENEDGEVYKVFSFSRSQVEISHPVEISVAK